MAVKLNLFQMFRKVVSMTEETTEMETQETLVEETTDSTPTETQIQIESTQVATEETN